MQTTPSKPSSSSESVPRPGPQPPSSVNNTPIVDRMVHVPFVREFPPLNAPDTNDAEVNTDNRVSVGVMAKDTSVPGTNRPEPGWAQAETAFTNEFAATPESDRFFRQMVRCLDFLWEEYSTVIGEDSGYRLMSLANMMRLCGDADFGIPTTDQIDVFLQTLRTSRSEFSLVEYKYFLPLMHGIGRKLFGSRDPIELTDILFKQYLFPLMQRVRMLDRQYSEKHPPLPPSPIHSPFRKPFM